MAEDPTTSFTTLQDLPSGSGPVVWGDFRIRQNPTPAGELLCPALVVVIALSPSVTETPPVLASPRAGLGSRPPLPGATIVGIPVRPSLRLWRRVPSLTPRSSILEVSGRDSDNPALQNGGRGIQRKKPPHTSRQDKLEWNISHRQRMSTDGASRLPGPRRPLCSGMEQQGRSQSKARFRNGVWGGRNPNGDQNGSKRGLREIGDSLRLGTTTPESGSNFDGDGVTVPDNPRSPPTWSKS